MHSDPSFCRRRISRKLSNGFLDPSTSKYRDPVSRLVITHVFMALSSTLRRWQRAYHIGSRKAVVDVYVSLMTVRCCLRQEDLGCWHQALVKYVYRTLMCCMLRWDKLDVDACVSQKFTHHTQEQQRSSNLTTTNEKVTTKGVSVDVKHSSVCAMVLRQSTTQSECECMR